MRNRLIELVGASAARDERVVFLTGDLGFSVVEPLRRDLGPRFVNAGIAEANMASMAGGLAMLGFLPVLYSIAPFVSLRCLEQIRNDLCLPQRPARLIGIGAGFAYGALGISHHALDDVTAMAALPGLWLANPGCRDELERLYPLLEEVPAPVYWRLGKDAGPPVTVEPLTLERPLSRLRDGDHITLVTSGAMLGEVLEAAETLSRDHDIRAGVLSLPLLRPFPQAALRAALADAPVMAVFEGYDDNPLAHGVMATILRPDATAAQRRFASLHVERRPPRAVGGRAALLADYGLDPVAIARRAVDLLIPASDRSPVSSRHCGGGQARSAPGEGQTKIPTGHASGSSV